MCSCSCQAKKAEQAPAEEKKNYVCYTCNAVKSTGGAEPAPECCGKKMDELD